MGLASKEIVARDERIVADYLTGKFTTRALGRKEGITHSRVAQVLLELAPSAYQRVLESRRAGFAAKRNARAEESCRKAYGCTREQLAAVLDVFPDAKVRFAENRANAQSRGRSWNLTFFEWASCWIDSGKLHLRDRVNGEERYGMGLRDQDAGYAVGNVVIQLVSELVGKGNYRAALRRRKDVFQAPVSHVTRNGEHRP